MLQGIWKFKLELSDKDPREDGCRVLDRRGYDKKAAAMTAGAKASADGFFASIYNEASGECLAEYRPM